MIEWSKINDYVEQKSTGLMMHENKTHENNPTHLPKDFIRARFDSSHARCILDRGRTFAVVSTNVFFEVMHNVLLEAAKSFPDHFGTRDANKVVEAIYKACPEGRSEDFSEFLRKEQFAYVFEIKGDEIIDKTLRLDFFRKIEVAKVGSGYDFTGGAFHALKHFSCEGMCLSTHKENFALPHPTSIVKHVIDAFFFHELIPANKKKTEYTSNIDLTKEHKLKFAFFHEPKNDIYFLNSVHPQ
jgi:hypothetical protein